MTVLAISRTCQVIVREIHPRLLSYGGGFSSMRNAAYRMPCVAQSYRFPQQQSHKTYAAIAGPLPAAVSVQSHHNVSKKANSNLFTTTGSVSPLL